MQGFILDRGRDAQLGEPADISELQGRGATEPT